MEMQKIEEKEIYKVEKHHHALSGWANYRKRLSSAPRLLSFDYHTDSNPAFTQYLIDKRFALSGFDEEIDEEEKIKLISSINFEDDTSIRGAIENLSHDEHIHAALCSKIISSAVVINYQEHGIKDRHGVLCVNAAPPIKSCDEREACAHALESNNIEFLLKKAKCFEDFIHNEESNFILDIDLDYFRSERSLQPRDISIFNKLIQRAGIITIAMERDYCEREKIEGEQITADQRYTLLLQHIRKAL